MPPHANDVFDAIDVPSLRVGGVEDVVDLLDNGAGSLQRRGIRQLNRRIQTVLVLVGDVAGRQAGRAVADQTHQDAIDDQHDHAARQGHADQGR